MQFCPKCGTMVIPGKGTKGKFACPSCNHKFSPKKEPLVLKERITHKDKIEVVDKPIETLPKVDQECSKCKNKKAFYWLLQTRAGDEAETTFYKCTKCNYTWRTY